MINRANIIEEYNHTRYVLSATHNEFRYFQNTSDISSKWKSNINYALFFSTQLCVTGNAGEKAYEHFGPPFLLNTTSLYRKIRNFQIRILPDDVLVPLEISKYDQKVVYEALHNCIAHQDYSKNSRIIVTEHPDYLQFENEGNFYEGRPDDYILGNKTPRKYRNPFLTQAMNELNMIDTMGYGIYQKLICAE